MGCRKIPSSSALLNTEHRLNSICRYMDNLFEKYTAAFNAFDALAISNLYTLPCSTSDADGARVFTDRDSLSAKFEKNCTSMQDMGYQFAEFKLLTEIRLGEASKAVNIAWRIHTEKSEIEFRTLYVCHKVEVNWLIFSANVYEGDFENETP